MIFEAYPDLIIRGLGYAFLKLFRACRGGCTVAVCHGTCHCRHRCRNSIKLIKKYYKIKIMNAAPHILRYQENLIVYKSPTVCHIFATSFVYFCRMLPGYDVPVLKRSSECSFPYALPDKCTL